MFGDKEFSQVGFPTPEETPIETTCLTLYIPANSAWWAVFTGLLLVLTEQASWQQFEGGMTTADAADAATTIVYEALDFAAIHDTCSTMVDAPFWDEESGDDTDDEMTVDDQTWYGQWDGESFIESLAYVFLTNFLAKLITPQGAIKYLTIPRTFRLLIKQNPHGAKLLLFLDGGLYAVVNGYSIVDQVLEVIVKAVAPMEGFRAFDVEPLELMIVNSGEHDPDATPDENGNYTVDVIRGRLSEEDVTPVNQRYNPDTDTVQYSPDGGTTWNDAEGQDPRRASAFLKPPLGGSTARCDAAANMVAWVKAFMDEIIADLDGIGTAGLIVSTALNAWSLLFEPLAIIDLIAGAAATIGGLGSSLLSTAFSSETYDLLLCILYCDIGDDGQVTDSQFAQIQADMADLNETAQIVMALILGAQGKVGLSNAGAIGSETGECDDCECLTCGFVDFTSGLHGWTILNDGTINARGMFVDGVGIVTTLVGDSPTEVYVYYRPSELNVRKIVINGHQFPSGTPLGTLEILLGSPPVVTDHFFIPSDADWQVIWVGNEDTDGFNLSLTMPGGGALERMEFYVVGELPDWLEPC